jgi:hypothetical protein
LKIQVISFAIFIIDPVAVTYSWLQLQKRSIKKEVKQEIIAGIDKKRIGFFQFSNKD